MSLTNPLGDQEITDPRAMRALAHPVRLAALTHLQRHGPATATMLSPVVRATPSVTSWHLRHLAGFGLVLDADPGEVPGDKRQRWWKAAGRGFRVKIGEGEEALAAARVLGGQMEAAGRRQIDTWLAETAPALEPAWLRLADVSNTYVSLAPGELARLQQQVDELLSPYVLREEKPDDARPVRFIRYLMPDGPS